MERAVDEVLACARQPLIEVVVVFFEKPIGPLTLMTLEMAPLGLETHGEFITTSAGSMSLEANTVSTESTCLARDDISPESTSSVSE